MLAATATIGPRRPTAATTVTLSTSIRATGTGSTAFGLTASLSGRFCLLRKVYKNYKCIDIKYINKSDDKRNSYNILTIVRIDRIAIETKDIIYD